MKKIGIYGGTFDPVHNAHLIHARYFTEFFGLDKCFFVPAAVSPFKRDNKTFLTDSQRIDCLKLALDGDDIFAVDNYEIISGGISYSIDTIHYFKKKFPKDDLFFLIGSDQAKSFKNWKDWENILSLVKVCVLDRHNRHRSKFADIQFIFINNPLIEISSSGIRERLEERKSVKFLVPDKVEEYLLRFTSSR